MSVVERTLHADPAGVYAAMDFATRDEYRHAVEQIAKRSRMSEDEVARQAVELAASPDGHGPGGARRVSTSSTAAAGPSSARRACGRRWACWFDGGPAVPAAALRRVDRASHRGLHHGRALVGGPARRVAVGRWRSSACCSRSAGASLRSRSSTGLSMLLVRPRILPRMDYARGIPDEHRTAVAVPTMLTDAAGVDELLEALEVRFLANRDENLSFALLSDFRDAAEQSAPSDAALLAHAKRGIEALNAKYGGEELSSASDRDGNGDGAPDTLPPGSARPRQVLPLSPRPALEREGRRLDGMGTQARQARRVQRRPPRRPVGVRHRRRAGRPAARRALRDHARQRHAAPPRRRPPTRRHPRSPTEPPAVSTNDSAASRKVTASSSRASASASPAPAARDSRPCSPATPGSIRTPAPFPTSTKTSSAKARSSGRESTTSTRFSRRSAGACRRTASSATT